MLVSVVSLAGDQDKSILLTLTERDIVDLLCSLSQALFNLRRDGDADFEIKTDFEIEDVKSAEPKFIPVLVIEDDEEADTEAATNE